MLLSQLLMNKLHHSVYRKAHRSFRINAPSHRNSCTVYFRMSAPFGWNLQSISKDCRCPKCGYITDKYHGTYIRKVQDLPILGKMVQLEICSHEYECINNDCEVTTFAETFDGFLNTYSRMTERCADFICTLAMESSCEGCARICKALGIKISGDTVIRLLLRKYESLPGPEVGDVIGVDDFAYKKRHTYGTIIVNEKNHEPIALLDGRNGDALRNWLKNNKHIKVVTRDRANAYDCFLLGTL